MAVAQPDHKRGRVHLNSVPSLDNVGEAVTIALEFSGSGDRSKLDHLLGDDRAGQFLRWLRAE
jgi:hypothetical protein